MNTLYRFAFSHLQSVAILQKYRYLNDLSQIKIICESADSIDNLWLTTDCKDDDFWISELGRCQEIGITSNAPSNLILGFFRDFLNGILLEMVVQNSNQ